MPTPWNSITGRTKVALVGAGFIADFHLQVLGQLEDVQVVAVCDADAERATAAARAHGVPHAVTDLDELPALGVQVVHLTVPPDLHVSLTRRLLELGLGVFVEKPLALGSDDAQALVDLARERGVPLAVNHNNVFHPAFVRLRARLEAGEIGRLEHVRVCLSVPLRQLDAGDFTHWMFREPRNIVFEQATHPISQLETLVGEVRHAHTTLLGTRELHPGQPFHNRWLVAAQAERGTVELYLSFGQSFTRSTVEVIGSDGSLEADLHNNLLCGERKTLWLDFWNSFLAGRGRARDLSRGARQGLLDWSFFTLGLGARKDAFWIGMRDSISAFHGALRGARALPGDGPSAVSVARWCEALVSTVSSQPPAVPSLPDPGPARPGEVVLTGATGFIGRRLVTRLLADDVPVTAITRRLHCLPPEVLEPALAGKLRVMRASLEDEEGLDRAFAGARACVHLATGGGDTWDEVQHGMVQGSLRVAQAAERAGLERFVYVSSVAALYTGPDAGVAELDDRQSTDPRPELRPVYARGKIAAEAALRDFDQRSRMEVCIARPGVVLGEGTPMQHSGVGLWVRDNHCVGWGHGEHPLPIVWVDDVADGLARAALHPGPELAGRAFNLCARAPLSAQQVVAALCEATGRDLHFHPRSLGLSQLIEVGKWIVKCVGGRKAPFPSYRDLKSRSLATPFSCMTARELLGWQPVEDHDALLDRVVRIYAPPRGT